MNTVEEREERMEKTEGRKKSYDRFLERTWLLCLGTQQLWLLHTQVWTHQHSILDGGKELTRRAPSLTEELIIVNECCRREHHIPPWSAIEGCSTIHQLPFPNW